MRSALLAIILVLALHAPSSGNVAADNTKHGGATFQERSAAEKESRSRYRDLEVASLVLIVVGGGAAILWAIRKK